MESVELWLSVLANSDVRTWYIVDFDFVFDTSAQYTSTGRSIAVILSAVEVGNVAEDQQPDHVLVGSLQLLLQRKLIKSLTQCKLLVDLILGNAIACDVKKALGPHGFNELLGKRLLAAGRVKLGEVDV